jgi:tripartite-type tricarboxylate transporter receptor subunit TctC
VHCSNAALSIFLRNSEGSVISALLKMPDIMTLAEAGIKGYRYVGWYGLWVPGSTAPGLITKIQNEVVKAGKDPVIHQKFDSQGLELVGSTPQELAKLTEEEFALNKKLTQSMGIIAE